MHLLLSLQKVLSWENLQIISDLFKNVNVTISWHKPVQCDAMDEEDLLKREKMKRLLKRFKTWRY